jgi:nicotinamidase-related amidase
MALVYGPPTRATLHLCVDMQRLFAPDGLWPVAWMTWALPRISAIAERFAERTIFTRFMPPVRPEEMPGTWQRYYQHWRDVTRERIAPELLDLIPQLAAFAPPAVVIDKPAYSAFTAPALRDELARRHCDGLVITGGETDVCVLATVLGAVDHGYRVILPLDAVCSSSDEGHDDLTDFYQRRLNYQIETVSTEELLQVWER